MSAPVDATRSSALVQTAKPRTAAPAADPALEPKDTVDQKAHDRERLMRNLHFGSLPGSIILLGFGIKSIKDAKTSHDRVNAMADTGMGAAHTLSSATTKLALFSGVAKAAWFPLALTGAAGATALVAVLDAGRDIYEGKQTGNKESYLASGFKLAAAGAMVAGIIATPGAIALPVAGAVLYGCTCLWQQRRQIKEKLPELKEKIAHLPQATAGAVRKAANFVSRPFRSEAHDEQPQAEVGTGA